MFWVIFKHCKSMLTMKVIYFSAKIQCQFFTAKHISFEIDGIFLMYFFAYKNIFMFISIEVSIENHFQKIRIQNWLWIFAKIKIKNLRQFPFKSVLGFHFFQQNSFQFLSKLWILGAKIQSQFFFKSNFGSKLSILGAKIQMTEINLT